MESLQSISGWIDRLVAGDDAAVQPLWEQYFQQLVRLARKKLQPAHRRAADEEDIALSAFDSFCRNAKQGHYPHLRDGESVWRLLAAITARKAAHLVRDDARQKRGGGRAPAPGWGPLELDQVFSRELNPEFAALMAEECTCLLRGLKDDKLEHVARWRMEGYTVKEIAQKMDVVPRSIQRKLNVIRTIWGKEATE
jgi:DNA-directed RNA polymerase specialized sigma24 family protein